MNGRTLFGRVTAAIVPVLLATILASCDSDGLDHDRRYEAVRAHGSTHDITTQAGLRLEAVNGEVVIRGRPGLAAVQISGERRVEAWSMAEAESHLDELSVEVEDAGNELVIRTAQPSGPSEERYTVDYLIEIPESWAVTVAQDNGTIMMEDVTGDVSATQANGEISFVALVGMGQQVSIALGNGALAVRLDDDSSAMISATVANGTITVQGLMLDEWTASANSLEGRIGAGEGCVTISLANGTILLSDRG